MSSSHISTSHSRLVCAALSLRRLMFLFLSLLAVASQGTEVPLVEDGGVLMVPTRINNVITLKFVVDSGAADVVVPADVVLTLVRAETITQSDFLPGQTYRLADGSSLKSPRFIIRRLELGDHVVENVTASLGSPEGMLLLGQSVLGRLPTWSIDNRRGVLVLKDPESHPTASPPISTPKEPTGLSVANPGAQKPASLSAVWRADWGNDIRATVMSTPCAVADFSPQGYHFALTVDIPVSRLGHPNDAWLIEGGRAVTVQGCWFQMSEGIIHAKYRRKKDGKVTEHDLNLKDGSWTSGQVHDLPQIPSGGRRRAIYFAAEKPPTDADVPPEAPLCYRFDVPSLEEQRARLQKKYATALSNVEMVMTGTARMLKAERMGDHGETIRYRYFESPAACMAYQQARADQEQKRGP